ncbi:hypothetical protein PR048_032671 [Dryococelus australis]|uniref:Dynein heavy chain AAA 5 extension domain-containing protein n=1 Tax=Dryococelus australis TaxID=614101 RepID=A0ABQ9G2W7_9NEOP|nr:hypothetical protein PR048_032671 [Dryococelus australis]
MLLVDMLLKDAARENGSGTKHMRFWMQAAFMFAGVWGLGGMLDADSRQMFDEFYRDMWRGTNPDYPLPESLDKVDVPLPSEGLIHDYFYVFKQKGAWKYWPEVLKSADIKETFSIQEIIIPTIDTLK